MRFLGILGRTSAVYARKVLSQVMLEVPALRQSRDDKMIAGSGFTGTTRGLVLQSRSRFDENLSEMEFSQGETVDLGSYYETQARRLERLKVIAPMIGLRQQNTIRNMSQITFGDNYYYSGRQMFSTTTKESFGGKSNPFVSRNLSQISGSEPSMQSSTNVSETPMPII